MSVGVVDVSKMPDTEVKSYLLDFQSMTIAMEKERMRIVRNRRAYSVVDEGQWPEGVAMRVKNEGRQVCSYPIIPQKVDGLTGTIMANWFDESFVPIEGDQGDKTRLLQNMLYSDKGIMDWNTSAMKCIKDGMICIGYEEMFIDTTWHDVGNIGFRNLDPTMIVRDPNWKSGRHADLKRVYRVGDLTAEDIENTFDDVGPEIIARAKFDRKMGKSYYPVQIEDKIVEKRFKAGYFRVIQCDHLEVEKQRIEFDTLSQKELPFTSHKFGSPEDIAEKKAWGDHNGIDWAMVALHDSIITLDRYVPVYYVTTICPELSGDYLLQDKKSEIQIKVLPIYCYSFMWVDGIPIGVVDLLIDAQQTLNKRESTLTHYLTTVAQGALLADTQTMFAGDKKKIDEFKLQKNDPSRVFEVAPGALEGGEGRLVQPVTKGATPVPDLFNVIQFNLDMINRISRQPDVQEGRMERSGQSGIAIGRLQAQSTVQQTTIMRDVRQHEKDKGEGYFYLARQLYSAKNPLYGSANYNRTFRSPDGDPEKSVQINKYKGVDEAGQDIVDDDISELDRHRLQITESPESLSNRIAQREVDNAILQNMSPDPVNALPRAIMQGDILRSLDLSDQMKAKLQDSAGTTYELAKEQTMAATAEAKAKRLQAEAMIAQLEGRQPQVNVNGAPGQPPQVSRGSSSVAPPMPAGHGMPMPEQVLSGQANPQPVMPEPAPGPPRPPMPSPMTGVQAP